MIQHLILKAEFKRNYTFNQLRALKFFVFLFQMMSALKTGAIANNRFAVIIERHHKHLTDEIPVDRSGGGL